MSAFIHAFRMPLALTLLALVAAFGHARAETIVTSSEEGPPGEIYLDVGATSRVLNNAVPYSGLFDLDWIVVPGIEIGAGRRLSDAFVLDMRTDVLWRQDALSVGTRAAALLDLDWPVSPIVGPWLGYRYTHAEFDGYTSTFNLGPAPPSYHYAGTVDGHDVSVGLEAGLRARAGRFTAALATQWGVALWSTRDTHQEADEHGPRAKLLVFGQTSDIGITLRAGVRW